MNSLKMLCFVSPTGENLLHKQKPRYHLVIKKAPTNILQQKHKMQLTPKKETMHNYRKTASAIETESIEKKEQENNEVELVITPGSQTRSGCPMFEGKIWLSRELETLKQQPWKCPRL